MVQLRIPCTDAASHDEVYFVGGPVIRTQKQR